MTYKCIYFNLKNKDKNSTKLCDATLTPIWDINDLKKVKNTNDIKKDNCKLLSQENEKNDIYKYLIININLSSEKKTKEKI